MKKTLVLVVLLLACAARASDLGTEVECTIARLHGCCASPATTTTTVPAPVALPPAYVCTAESWRAGQRVLRCVPVMP